MYIDWHIESFVFWLSFFFQQSSTATASLPTLNLSACQSHVPYSLYLNSSTLGRVKKLFNRLIRQLRKTKCDTS